MDITYGSADFNPRQVRVIRNQYPDGGWDFTIEIPRADGQVDEITFFAPNRMEATILSHKFAHPAIEGVDGTPLKDVEAEIAEALVEF